MGGVKSDVHNSYLEEVRQVHAEALEDLVAQGCRVGQDPLLQRLLWVSCQGGRATGVCAHPASVRECSNHNPAVDCQLAVTL